MKDKLIEILPEFLMIKESELMDKVINVWQEAINEGGWSIEDLESMPFTHTIKNCPVSIIDNTGRLLNLLTNRLLKWSIYIRIS